MRRIGRFAVAGVLAVCVAGAALAAGNGQARQVRVLDLVKVVAAAKNLSTKQVSEFLEKKGIDSNALLTERLAAEAFGALGVAGLTSSQNRSITDSQLGTLRTLASLVDTRSLVSTQVAGAQDSSAGSGGGCKSGIDGDPHESGDVNNCGRKTRTSGASPSSNADVNAFQSLRDDPRD